MDSYNTSIRNTMIQVSNSAVGGSIGKQSNGGRVTVGGSVNDTEVHTAKPTEPDSVGLAVSGTRVRGTSAQAAKPTGPDSVGLAISGKSAMNDNKGPAWTEVKSVRAKAIVATYHAHDAVPRRGARLRPEHANRGDKKPSGDSGNASESSNDRSGTATAKNTVRAAVLSAVNVRSKH